MIRWVTLLPDVPNPHGFFAPDTRVRLVQHSPYHEPFRFQRDVRFRRMMTHPADARAGWCLDGSSLRLPIDPIGPLDAEIRFDAFHWALAHKAMGWERWVFLEPIEFAPIAVLRAPEPRRMIHGLWIELSDSRCEPPVWTHAGAWPPAHVSGPRLMPVGKDPIDDA